MKAILCRGDMFRISGVDGSVDAVVLELNVAPDPVPDSPADQ